MRRTIVLYNPPAVFWTMPLALVAVGSALVRRGYDVVVVDGRLDHESRLLDAIGDALCLGITVLTGQPLAEAMAVTRRVRELRPDLPVVWGGWHPSLFPAACIEEGGAMAAVVGQGEQTMTEIADRLASGGDLAGVAGCWYAGSGGCAIQNPPRPMDDLNRLTSHDYRLIDVEAYFQAKGRRQLDFVTSQGCLFRCSFCADPAVFGRGWSGLDPARVLDELDVLHQRFGMTDLAFQDETFFTNPLRVQTIARGFLDAGRRFTWTATLRADQGRRMTDENFELLRASGLRKVVLGVESGSAKTLRRIRKDITLDDVRTTAARLVRHGIGADIGIIVGFPDEPERSVLDSLEIAGELCDMSPLFSVSLFNYQPYPGSAIADGLRARGGLIPSSLEEWAAFDYVDGRSDFLSPRLDRVVEHFRFYKRFAFARTRNPARWPLHALARWRVARHAYALPLERRVIERWWPTREQS